MAKYIKLEDLMKFPIRRNHYDKEHGNEDFICGIETVLEYAENLPAADVTQVRHGHWIRVSLIGVFECSECGGQITVVDSKFAKEVCRWCLFCGAKMDEENDE